MNRQDILDKIWFGKDPFAGFPGGLYAGDQQGWNNDHPLLIKAINDLKPQLVVEVGVWKGRSVITMVDKMKSLGIQGVIIAVDTWLGAAEHWFDRDYHKSLRINNGFPSLCHCFMQNIIDCDITDYIVPFPIDSVNAAEVLRARSIFFDLLHLDGAHDYRSVKSDLTAWWPLIRPGGGIVCDDYVADGSAWEGLKRAVDEFVEEERIGDFTTEYPKAFFRKPPLASA